jgi:hypothetical protein
LHQNKDLKRYCTILVDEQSSAGDAVLLGKLLFWRGFSGVLGVPKTGRRRGVDGMESAIIPSRVPVSFLARLYFACA